MSILIFLLVLFVLILVHEWGHFIVAKKTGMRVDEFAIGFPPKLFGIKRGETEYTFNSLPIGGFVRIWGEDFANPDDKDANNQDRSRSFSARPKWAQALVLVAGVTMNILFAWFLFSLTYMIGVPQEVDELQATESAELTILEVRPGSPSEIIPPGAVIKSLKTTEGEFSSPTPSAFSEAVAKSSPDPVSITYQFKDEEKTVDLTPIKGLILEEPDRYIIGVRLAMMENVQQPFFTAIFNGLLSTYHGFISICVGLWNLLSDAVFGQADFSQIAGPVGIVGMVGDAASFGIATLLIFTAIISLNLAVINLLPFPALDGGRLVFVAIETITRRPIPPEWAGRINLAGFALLMILMIAVTYNDIIRLL